jgi:hypothetical protein
MEGSSVMKRFGFVAIFAFVASAVFAVPPNYSFNRSLSLGPHPDISRANNAVSDAAGGLYFTDSGSDGIYYVNDVFTSTGNFTTDTVRVIAGVSGATGGLGPDFTSGNSYEGVTIAPNGTIYGGGKNGAGVSQYVRLVPDNVTTPTAWTFTTFNPAFEFSGPSAIGNGKLVVSNATNGAVSFLTDTGPSLTQDGGFPVAGGAAQSHNVVADNVHNKIF